MPRGCSYPLGCLIAKLLSVNSSVLSGTCARCDFDTNHTTFMRLSSGSFFLLSWYTRSSTVAFIGADTITFLLLPLILFAYAAIVAICVVTFVLPHPGGPLITLIL